MLGDGPSFSNVKTMSLNRLIMEYQTIRDMFERWIYNRVFRREIPRIATMAAVPTALLFGDEIRHKLGEESVAAKAVALLQNNPVLATAFGLALPTLYPEAKASAAALSFIKQERGSAAAWDAFKKILGPAFVTHALPTVPFLAGAYALKKGMEITKKEEHQP